jgi:bacteriocin-like protein
MTMEQTGSKTGGKPASDKGKAAETSKDNSTELSEDELKEVSGGTTKPTASWNVVTNRTI